MKLPFRCTLLVLFVICSLAIAVVSFIPIYFVGLRGVRYATDELQLTLRTHVSTLFEDFIATVQGENTKFFHQHSQGLISPYADHTTIKRWLCSILNTSKHVLYAQVATEADGMFHGCQKFVNFTTGELIRYELNIRNASNYSQLHYIVIDPETYREQELYRTIDGYDPRQRPWYQRVVQQQSWTDPYLYSAGTPIGVTAGLPLFDPRTKAKIGVFAVDIIVDSVSHFLQQLKFGDSGVAFIIDSGTTEVLGVSWDEQIFSKLAGGNFQDWKIVLKKAENLTHAFAASAVQALGGTSKTIISTPAGLYKSDHVWADVHHVSDDYGLNWAVVIALNEEDFMGEFRTERVRTVVIVLVLLFVLIVLQSGIAHVVVTSLDSLTHRMELLEVSIAEVENEGRALELSKVVQSDREQQLASTEELLALHKTQSSRDVYMQQLTSASSANKGVVGLSGAGANGVGGNGQAGAEEEETADLYGDRKYKSATFKTSIVSEVARVERSFMHMQTTIRSFARFVPREVVYDLLSRGEIAEVCMVEQKCAVLFCDVVQFTRMADNVSTLELASIMEVYFDSTTRIIHQHGGSVDKYIGDCIMCVWGAPMECDYKSIRACSCALSLLRLVESNAMQLAFLPTMLPCKVRIGLHTGKCLAGNMGGANRLNYTLVGSNVNFAARLESLNKMLGTRILVSEEVNKETHHIFSNRLIHKVKLYGFNTVERVYELCGLRANFITCLPAFSAGQGDSVSPIGGVSPRELTVNDIQDCELASVTESDVQGETLQDEANEKMKGSSSLGNGGAGPHLVSITPSANGGGGGGGLNDSAASAEHRDGNPLQAGATSREPKRTKSRTSIVESEGGSFRGGVSSGKQPLHGSRAGAFTRRLRSREHYNMTQLLKSAEANLHVCSRDEDDYNGLYTRAVESYLEGDFKDSVDTFEACEAMRPEGLYDVSKKMMGDSRKALEMDDDEREAKAKEDRSLVLQNK